MTVQSFSAVNGNISSLSAGALNIAGNIVASGQSGITANVIIPAVANLRIVNGLVVGIV